jgi:hypothetical protein
MAKKTTSESLLENHLDSLREQPCGSEHSYTLRYLRCALIKREQALKPENSPTSSAPAPVTATTFYFLNFQTLFTLKIKLRNYLMQSTHLKFY